MSDDIVTVYEVNRNLNQLRTDIFRKFDELNVYPRGEAEAVIAAVRDRLAGQDDSIKSTNKRIDNIESKLSTWTWRFVGSMVVPVVLVLLTNWLAGGR